MDLSSIGDWLKEKFNQGTIKSPIPQQTQSNNSFLDRVQQVIGNNIQKVQNFGNNFYQKEIVSPQGTFNLDSNIRSIAGQDLNQDWNKYNPVEKAFKTIGNISASAGIAMPQSNMLLKSWEPIQNIQNEISKSTEKRISNDPFYKENPNLAMVDRLTSNYLTGGILFSSPGNTRDFRKLDLNKVFHPEDKKIMQEFAIKVDELGPKANKADLGELGKSVDNIVTHYFGSKYRDLSNVKIKQLFDYTMAKMEASKGGDAFVQKPRGVELPIGLKTQKTEGFAQQAFKNNKIPTPEEVALTIDDKIDDLVKSTAGYSTKAPIGGTKTANPITQSIRKITGDISSRVEKGLQSENSLVRNASNILHGFFRELGSSPERYIKNLELKGGITAPQQRWFDVGDSLMKSIKYDKNSLERINSVLDPEISKIKVSYKNLTPNEKEVYNLIRKGYDLTHDISYANGAIDKKLYLKNKGKYSARLYKEFELPSEINEFANKSYKKIVDSMYKAKGDLSNKKIEDSLNNPIYGMAKRLTQVESNMAVKKYINFINSKEGYVSQIPRDGFTKLSESKAYGDLSGKYVLNSVAEDLKGYFFSNKMLDTVYDAFRLYDNLPPRQLYKKLLTVFNPTTNIGNITTDNIFGFLTGVDPFTLNKNIAKLISNKNEFKQISNYLMNKGIIGTDITRTDFVNKIGTVDSLVDNKLSFLSKAGNKIQGFYGGTDDIYKAAAFKALLDKGKTLEEATKLVSDGFQNYASVGKFFDIASKTPIIGQPFIKFQGDLLRIIKNAAVNNPLNLITFLATLQGISILTSKLSGENEEQKIARENRFGTTKIPGLNIPLNWQTPIGEINVARYIAPFYTANLNDSDVNQTLSKVVPFYPEIKTKKSGEIDTLSTIAANANDPLFAPLIQLGVNRDFRGKPITDPKASEFFGSDLPKQEQQLKQSEFLTRSYAGPQINSLLDLISALKGQEDMYGKQRTPLQGMLRVAGIKLEDASPKVIKEQNEKTNYFNAQIPAFENLKAIEKAAVLGIPKQEPNDTQDKVTKYNLLLQYPNVYNYFKEIAFNKVNGDLNKIDPLYTFPYKDVKSYMRYQSLGGSDWNSQEAKDLYKSNPIIGEISKARSVYFEKNPIEGSLKSNKPQASEYVQSQMNSKNWSDQQVKAFLDAINAYRNEQREKAGLPPLPGFIQFAKKPKKVNIKKISIKKVSNPSLKKISIKIPKMKKIKPNKFKIKNLTKQNKKINIKIKA